MGNWICDGDPFVDAGVTCVQMLLTVSPWGAFAAMTEAQALVIVGLSWAAFGAAWGFRSIIRYVRR